MNVIFNKWLINLKKEYYIYEWYNVDTNVVFYVGKGKNNRKDIKSGRNKIDKKYNVFRVLLSHLLNMLISCQA